VTGDRTGALIHLFAIDARDISFVALRLSGERSHCVLVFPRVSFSRCRAGDMI
jgi:hypothetical protein